MSFSAEEKEAFDYCSKLSKEHYENFPVGSILIPRKKQPYIHAIYAFARIADDFADEPDFTEDRILALNRWASLLKDCYNGQADHPVFVALKKTIQDCNIPEELFLDLITAFKMDVEKKRYQTFDEVLFYCKHSANPIGRLVLLVFGHVNENWMKYSDYICTALQLTNFWQDIAIDLQKERIYIPVEDLKKYKVLEKDLNQYLVNDRFCQLMQFQIERTYDLFVKGLPLCFEMSSKRLSWELKTVWQGGVAILNEIKKRNYDIFCNRPKLTKVDFVRCFLKIIWMKP